MPSVVDATSVRVKSPLVVQLNSENIVDRFSLNTDKVRRSTQLDGRQTEPFNSVVILQRSTQFVIMKRSTQFVIMQRSTQFD